MEFFSSLTIFDYVLLFILLLSLITGIWRGFVKEALSLLVWVAAFALGFLFSSHVAVFLAKYIHSEVAVNVSSFIIIFLLVLIVGKLLTVLIASMVDRLFAVSVANRLLGAIFGLGRGLLIAVAIIFLIELSPWHNRSWFEMSQLVLWSQHLVHWMQEQIIPPQTMTNLSKL